MTLTTEQSKAIEVFAMLNGRNWKSVLRQAWMTGNYDGFEMSNFLQQIRNSLGPTWLTRYRIPRQF